MTLSGFPAPIRFDRFTLSPEQRSLTSAGAPVALSSRAYDILVLLLQRRDQLVSKEQLLDRVWPETVVEENNLAVQLSGLRRALGERTGGGPFILTVPGRGYRFVCPVSCVEEPSARSAPPAITRARLPLIALVARPPAGSNACATVLLAALQDELSLALGRSRAVWVALPSTGDQVDADYLVETSLQFAERRVTLTLKLVHRATARLVLAERTDVAAEERAIAGEAVRLAFAIEHALTLTALADVTPASEARALFIEGYKLHETLRLSNVDAAETLFRRSALMDPHYARPIVALASVELTRPMLSPSDLPIGPFAERGLGLARRAVSVDPWDPWAHIMLAWALTRQRRAGLAFEQFERALSLNPDNPLIMISAAEGLALLGRPERGIPLGERALRLHPAPPDYFFSYLATAYSAAGAHEKALECLARLDHVVPKDFAIWALSLAGEGRHKEARTMAATFFKTVRDRWTGVSHPHETAILDWMMQVNPMADKQKRLDAAHKLRGYI